MKIPYRASLTVGLVILAGCRDEAAPQQSRSAALTARTAPGTASGSTFGLCDAVDIDRSMVVRDQATIAANFSFQKVIEAIRLSSPGTTSLTDADLAQTLTSGLLTNPFTQPVSGLDIPADLRTPEAALTGADLLSQMEPIALFNRFDLVPADGFHCGEYRIVYGRYPNAQTNRYLLIFESVLPNPNPSDGIEGCRPVAEFWHGLSDPALTTAQRASMLESFYFSGLPGFSPVVQHAHYGFPFGQVRSNMFKDASTLGFTWQLREWRTSIDTSGDPVFVPDTDKDNPLVEFYDETSSHPDPAGFATEQSAFQAHFTNDVMENLLAFELGEPPPAACPEVNIFGAGFDNRFNEFQSTAGPGLNPDDPTATASLNFRNAVSTSIPGGTSVNDTHILNRATAMTCAGCHQLSNGDPISNTASWPSSSGFVHVEELGGSPPANTPLSPALTSCFLPARRDILEDFVCTSGGTDGGIGDGGTDGGAPDSGSDAGGSTDAGAPTTCGGPYGANCGPSEFCDFDIYDACGAQGTGICQPRPASCLYTAVSQACGCDGTTYANACLAQQAGTDVASSGSCGCNLRPPRGCCYEDAQCGRGGVCAGASCTKSGAGVCKGPPPTKGTCWSSSQCGAGQVCAGAEICPCGARCIRPDSPGKCVTPRETTSPEVTSATRTLLESSTDAQREAARTTLESEVEQQRELEREKAGAFRRVRRSH